MTLTGNKNYVIRSIDGLTPPFATVNSSVVAMVDGAIYNSARVETRNIIITISPLIPVEANRNALYKYFPIKKKIRLYYENGMKHVYIDGYVDSIDGSLFEISQTLTISIICLEPYWKSQILSNADVSDTEGLFEFPFAIPSDGIEFSRINKTSTVNIVNYGDVEIGMIIELIADDYVSNPTIYRTATGEMFSLIYYMHPKDKITINTNRNSKSIILTRNGEKSNIINSLVMGSVWFELDLGDNIFSYKCDDGAN
ncbi:MAG TPA: phage tail family protein, partial [Firmicutes bacterium]|nr:phage tail family protein [Bacillota bacterium]